MHFIYVTHLLYRTVTEHVTTDYNQNRRAPGWIMSFPIDHANSTWPERKKDQFKAMIDKLQKVKRWLGVETSLREKLPAGALFIFPLLKPSFIFLEHAVPNWWECLWSAVPHRAQHLVLSPGCFSVTFMKTGTFFLL